MTGFEKSLLCESSGLGDSIQISYIPTYSKTVRLWIYLETCLPCSCVEQPFALKNKKGDFFLAQMIT